MLLCAKPRCAAGLPVCPLAVGPAAHPLGRLPTAFLPPSWLARLAGLLGQLACLAGCLLGWSAGSLARGLGWLAGGRLLFH